MAPLTKLAINSQAGETGYHEDRKSGFQKRTLSLAVSWILTDISKKKASGDTLGFITDATWTMIKAVDGNLANSKDKNTFTSLKTDTNQYLT